MYNEYVSIGIMKILTMQELHEIKTAKKETWVIIF